MGSDKIKKSNLSDNNHVLYLLQCFVLKAQVIHLSWF